MTSCLRPSFPPSVGITFFLFFASGCGAARVANRVFHNNVGGALRNLALTNGFLNILHFFIFKKSNTIIRFSSFSTPLMKYCNFWYLICSIWASILAKSICQNLHSRARGVANLENVIPMLGGKHYLFWFPCSVGTLIQFLSTPLRWECSYKC